MGGLVNSQTVKGDLWMIGAGEASLPCHPIGTKFDGPGPRVGHASLLVGNAFIVFGGDTKTNEQDKLDDTLYLLNTCTAVCCPSSLEITNIDSIPPVVKVEPSRATSSGAIWAHLEYPGFETLRVWRAGGRLLLQ